MRFQKGTIKLSRDRDWPILEIVFRCGFITSDQIFALTQPVNASRSAFSCRLTRLVQHGLLLKETGIAGMWRPVYRATDDCIHLLLQGGEFYSGRTGFEGHTHACLHALAINELQLALYRSGRLARWIPLTQICSRNDYIQAHRYSKDYDGIAVMRVGEQREVPLAIEYERVMKAAYRYDQIREALETERYLRLLLFVTPHIHIAKFLCDKFQNTVEMNVCVCLLGDFLSDPWNVRVKVATQKLELSLRYALDLLPGPREQDPFSAVA